jgi:hypothetical protein
VPGQTLTTEAFVIEKRPPADAFQTLGLFSGEHGNLLALQRVSRKASLATAVPDLFDQVGALLESSNQGRTWFVKELRITTRRPGIGRSYEALRAASSLALLVSRNPVHEESRDAVARLLSAAFDALDTGARPDAVYLKGLYVFARDEGYPVKQEWIPGLPADDRAVALSVLNRALGEQDADAAAVLRVTASLERYLKGNAEMLLP